MFVQIYEDKPELTSYDYRRFVEDLAIGHRSQEAMRRLMAAGSLATPVVREGLRHPEPAVRVGCCKILDHFMDENALPELMENLYHEDEMVRAWALHALACDRCKEGTCRPGEAQVVPIAIQMLLEDKSHRVREMAAGLLGPSVHRQPEILPALEWVRAHDPHPNVRKIASWYTSGGPRYKRLMPKPSRARSNAPSQMPPESSEY
jgi:hypothetical protein